MKTKSFKIKKQTLGVFKKSMTKGEKQNLPTLSDPTTVTTTTSIGITTVIHG